MSKDPKGEENQLLPGGSVPAEGTGQARAPRQACSWPGEEASSAWGPQIVLETEFRGHTLWPAQVTVTG